MPKKNDWSIKMRMSRMMLGALGMMASSVSSVVVSAPSLGGEFSPFTFKAKPVGSKPNKVSQKKRRLNARRLNKHK